MSEFGEALRELRARRGYRRQEDLAAALGGEVARSTIANLETGRQRITPRVWNAFARHMPDEAAWLAPIYARTRAEQEAAAAQRRPARRTTPTEQAEPEPTPDYVLERYDVIYVLRESRSPEEIIELRRVRSRTSGAHDFGLSFSRDTTEFEVETEVLFGGEIVGFDLQTPRGKTLIMQLLDFGRALRKGERHSFGVRYLVDRNRNFDDTEHVVLSTDYVMEEVGVHFNFWGSEQPTLCWAYEGYPDAAMAPGEPDDGVALRLNQHNMASAEFRRPVTGTHFGVAWRW